MPRYRTIIPLAAALALAVPLQGRAASVYDDDFSDGVRGPQWSGLTDDAAHLSLAEQGGRLDLLNKPGGTVNDDALYLSNFRLSTAANFVIRLDYSFTTPPTGGSIGDALALAFGVGRDAEGTDSAAIGQGYTTVSFLGSPATGAGAQIAHRTDDVQTTDATLPLAATTGTFEISYDAAGDDLTLRRVGSGISYTLNDTVKTVWGASDLIVSFGGRGEGYTTTAGQAFVDNFTIVSGSVVPEPAGLTIVGGGLLALGRRRFGRRL